MGEFFRNRLYTLYRDPITTVPGGGAKKGGEASGNGAGGAAPGAGGQVPTRPFQNWMEAVNAALLALLFEEVFIIDDDYIAEFGLDQGDGLFSLNDIPIGDADVLRFSNTNRIIVTGFLADRPSQQVLMVSVGLGQVDLIDNSDPNLSGMSLEENRILTGVRAVISMAPGVGFGRIYYDGTDLRWRVVTFEQGAAITFHQPFEATFYTADASGSPHGTEDGVWDMLISNRFTQAYYLKGAMLHVTFRLLATAVTGIADRLLVELPQDYVAKKHVTGIIFVRTGPTAIGYPALLQVREGDRQMSIELFNQEGGGIQGDVDVLGQFWMEIGSEGGGIEGFPGDSGPSAGGSAGGGADDGAGGTTGSQPPRATVPLPSISSINSILRAYDTTAGNTLCEINRNGGDPGFAWLDGAILALRAAQGERWGYRANRGDTNVLSGDAACYWHGPLPPVFGGTNVYDLDLVISANDPRGCQDTKIDARDGTDYSGGQRTGWARVRLPGGRIGGP